MKYVITGALGHIGSQLIRTLPDRFPDAEIVLLDNLLTQRYCSLFDLPTAGRYRFVEADLLTTDLQALLDGAHAVIHLAAITDATNSFQNREEVERVNYLGTERLAAACMESGCALIFPSTTSVYGVQSELVDEYCHVSKLKPQSPYAETKLRSEQLLQTMALESGLRFVICRFGTIFGTSAGMRFHTAINKFCWQAVMGQPLTVWETAFNQSRPYLDLRDAVAAIGFIIERQLFDSQIYNVVTTNATVKDIIDIISTRIENLEIQYIQSEIMNQLSYHVSNERFVALGFDFEGNLEQGIYDTIARLQMANYHPFTSSWVRCEYLAALAF